MRWALLAALAAILAAAGCTTPLALGERLYREGDRLGALESWRAIPEDNKEYEEAQERIGVVEEEFKTLVARYKQSARYFEAKERLAESVLNYRLSLKLQPDDPVILSHVQQLVRTLAAHKAELGATYRAAFNRGELPAARRELERLRLYDPFDPELESEERRLEEALRAEVELRLDLGRQEVATGRYPEAREAFGSVLELDPGNESALGYLSFIETTERSRRRAAAVALGRSGASDAEIRAEGFYQNALAAQEDNDPYAAIRYDLLALGAWSEHQQAALHLAKLRAQLAHRVDGLIELGRTAFREEDLLSALDSWRRALLIDPGNERAAAYVARAERQLENLDRLRAEPDPRAEGE